MYITLGNRLGFIGTNTDYLIKNQEKSFNDLTGDIEYFWRSETFLDITKDNYLFLKINDYGIIYNNKRDKNLLAKIILYDQQFVIDNGSNFLTKTYKFKQPVNISKLDIELINVYGNTIDMNNINYSITLECGENYDTIAYNKNNFNIFKY